MKKKLTTLVLTGLITFSSLSTAFAGSWLQDNVGWWFQNDDGSYPANGWHWIDGNNDGTAECYYFDLSGYCLLDTTTPDGYTVDANGAWIVNGVVQTQQAIVPTVVESTQMNTEVTAAVAVNETIEVKDSWTGSYPYVDGMVRTQPEGGSFWTVNISTGKYHMTPYVDNLLPKNTAYFLGDAATLENNGYSRCKKNGCK